MPEVSVHENKRPGNNGGFTVEKPIEDVFNEDLPPDRFKQLKPGEQPMSFLEQYEAAEDAEEKNRLLKQQILYQAELLAQKKQPASDINEPYPGFNPKDPDPKFHYSGLLYQIEGSGKLNYLEEIFELNYEDIASRYGAGAYELRMPSNTTKIRMQFKIGKQLSSRMKAQRGDEERFEKPVITDESKKENAPINPMTDLNALLLKIAEDKSKTLETLLTTVLSQDKGASGNSLQAAYKDGFDAGKSAMDAVIDAKDQQIAALTRERDEWKMKTETLQEERGQLPSTGNDEPEPEKPQTSTEILMEKIGEGIGRAINNIVNNPGATQAQKQIPNQSEQTKVDIPDTIKSFILESFKSNVPAVNTALALWNWIKDNKLTDTVKDYADYPTKMILSQMVKRYMPQADDALKAFAAQTIEEMKKLIKA